MKRRYRRNPDSVLGQIAVNTSQDIVLAAIGIGIVGGIAYLVYTKMQEAAVRAAAQDAVSGASTGAAGGALNQPGVLINSPYDDIGPAASIQGYAPDS
jgi:hypothetical protein